MNKISKLLCIVLCILMTAQSAFASYDWAEDAVSFCTENKIMEGDENGNLNLGDNLTRAQMAKMISVACLSEDVKNSTKMKFSDVSKNTWYYSYILKIQDYITETSDYFRPDEFATREDFFSCVIYASQILVNVEEDVLAERFSDADDVSQHNIEAINAAVFHGYIVGDERGLRPKDNLTRAETCVFLNRILNSDDEETQEAPPTEIDGVPVPTDSKYTYNKTEILGESVKTMEEALLWAQRNNAAQCFIDAAPLYWKYGEVFGIRADVMYAQAAKETGFGKYTGKVKPEMNNWAGIKKYGAVGDETDDHETFATPDDGVRGHFNHMSAYVGVEPVGETHGRYKSVKSLTWAGSIKYVEQLGGKWCPDVNYGYSVLADYVDKM